ncbi:hypothetical protein NLJ89_g9473 [Agrocybe chaxingu]|uniref:Uncharacterized protein n=1 Tax=Agrocybe chaxingu TaxID=84603 RepID=A0A9W8K0I6_9AGAR|nr:hypothetical protein NLJ89_g9473 [Agrocybe chaxingu]
MYSECGYEPQHDEVNLVRLLRRLEKSVADPQEWRPNAMQTLDVWLKSQMTLQASGCSLILSNVYRLVDDLDPSPNHIKLNDTKIKLDRIDTFLKDVQKACKPSPTQPTSLLASLPIPEPPEEKGISPAEQPSSPRTQSLLAEPSVSTVGLTISPPDPEGISPSLITAALPSLLPLSAAEAAPTSAFSHGLGPTPTSRKVAGGSGGGATSMAIQEELSSQLELMAQQLKRNAIHFSTSLANDKAVVEAAQEKLESNYDAMQSQRTKLKSHSSKSSSTTWLVTGIILVVVLLFMLMVSVIRFS